MKKLKGLLLIIIGICFFSTLNVNAAIENGTGSESTSGIGYSIESFDILVFNDQGLQKTQTNAGNSIKTINVSDVYINPSPARIDSMKGDYQLVSVKLNITGGLDAIKDKIKTELTREKESLTGGKNEKYLVTFSVRYKLTYPETIKAVWDADYANVFSGDQQLTNDETTASKTGLSQIIFSGVYDKNADSIDWSNGAKLAYDTDRGEHVFTSRYNDMPLLDEYLLFGEGRCQIGLEKYRFMVHDIENIETSGYWDEKTDDDSDNSSAPTTVTPSSTNTNNTPKNSSTRVAVPNTAAEDSWRLLVGISILCLGSGIVLWQLRKVS